jgi:hypothetical protein
MNCNRFGPPILSRREMLARAGCGFGLLALADLLAAEEPVRPREGAKAKSVIFLFMGGGPSQVDTFDPKPLLQRLNGQDVPASIARDIPRIARAPLNNLFASPYRFTRRGQSGIPVSEIYPHLGSVADELCILRSCRHDSPIHAPAEYLATTGTQVGDRPSIGAWVYYGLGTESQNLPGFIVMKAGETGRPVAWSSGFLPARYQGTIVERTGIPHASLPPGTRAEDREAQLDLMRELNRHRSGLPSPAGRGAGGEGGELEARIRSYELAFRMQTAAPETFDLARESQTTKHLYGIGVEDTNEFGTMCLLARRFVERGVRFIQLRSGGWDAHGDLVANHTPQARKTDRPIAALLIDLKRRGLLDQTLVVWGGEFGRTPAAENRTASPGRNHSPSGYSMWLAGGGVRGGHIVGTTDPVGYAAVERPIHPNDLHATILDALGVNQHRLVYRHHNRNEMATVNGGQVIGEVFA